MADHIAGLVEEHNKLHDAEDQASRPAKHDCGAFRAKLSRLFERRELVNKLLWQSVTEEHPQVAINAVDIREGWLLFDTGGDWNDVVNVTDGQDLVDRYIARVASIICDNCILVKEDDLEPVGADEEIIGSLDDRRIQTLWSLADEIHHGFQEQLPGSITKPDRAKVGDMTVNEINRLIVLAGRTKELHATNMSLFWRAVQDAVPQADGVASIGVRRGWQIVKCTPSDVAEGIELIMTGQGPAISISIPQLLEARLRSSGKL